MVSLRPRTSRSRKRRLDYTNNAHKVDADVVGRQNRILFRSKGFWLVDAVRCCMQRHTVVTGSYSDKFFHVCIRMT